jgi:hypothetical protein
MAPEWSLYRPASGWLFHQCMPKAYVLDNQGDGEVDEAVGVMAAGVGQVGHLGDKGLAATAAVVLGVEHNDVAGSPGESVSQVVEGPATEPIALGAVTTVRAGAPPVIPAADADLGLGQILGAGDSQSGIGAVFAGSWHGATPVRRVLPGNTSEDGKVFTDSARFPCQRLGFLPTRGFRSADDAANLAL